MKAWAAGGCLLFALAGAAAEGPPPFTEDEIRAILAHGPWPVPLATDPGKNGAFTWWSSSSRSAPSAIPGGRTI